MTFSSLKIKIKTNFFKVSVLVSMLVHLFFLLGFKNIKSNDQKNTVKAKKSDHEFLNFSLKNSNEKASDRNRFVNREGFFLKNDKRKNHGDKQMHQKSLSRNIHLKLKKEYEDLVREKIIRYKWYPVSAKRKKQEGMVDVEIKINPDGHLAGFKIINPSSYENLNKTVEQLINRVAPFPPFNINMLQEKIIIRFNVEFSLHNENK